MMGLLIVKNEWNIFMPHFGYPGRVYIIYLPLREKIKNGNDSKNGANRGYEITARAVRVKDENGCTYNTTSG